MMKKYFSSRFFLNFKSIFSAIQHSQPELLRVSEQETARQILVWLRLFPWYSLVWRCGGMCCKWCCDPPILKWSQTLIVSKILLRRSQTINSGAKSIYFVCFIDSQRKNARLARKKQRISRIQSIKNNHCYVICSTLSVISG